MVLIVAFMGLVALICLVALMGQNDCLFSWLFWLFSRQAVFLYYPFCLALPIFAHSPCANREMRSQFQQLSILLFHAECSGLSVQTNKPRLLRWSYLFSFLEQAETNKQRFEAELELHNE